MPKVRDGREPEHLDSTSPRRRTANADHWAQRRVPEGDVRSAHVLRERACRSPPHEVGGVNECRYAAPPPSVPAPHRGPAPLQPFAPLQPSAFLRPFAPLQPEPHGRTHRRRVVSGHSHSHSHPGAAHRWRLRTAFVLVSGFFVVELVTALVSRSLALLSDAGHMAADVVALGAALVATRIAARADTTGRRTFGSYRSEVFASGLAVLLMLGVSAYIAVEAVRRIGSSPEVSSGPMLVVGSIGLVVNVVCLALLRGGAKESLNVKGAYLEVVADALGSLGVIAAGVLVAATGSAWWDTGIALAIAVFVAFRAWLLGREVLGVLGQHVPVGMDADTVALALASVPGVSDVHDLHVWTLTSGMNVATAHLVTAEHADAHGVLDQAMHVMRTQFGVEHATLQVEPDTHTGCKEVTW